MHLLRVLDFTKDLIAKYVNEGDTVIDATCGNGHDTLFLAKLIGENGKVFGFDVQENAINNSKTLLLDQKLLGRVECINDGHEKMASYVKAPVRAVMFNLGYLPGSDKTIITNAKTTIKAIESALELLEKNGIITVVVYQGHDKGFEALEIEAFLKTLPQKQFSVLRYQFVNQIHFPPYLLAIEKKYRIAASF